MQAKMPEDQKGELGYTGYMGRRCSGWVTSGDGDYVMGIKVGTRRLHSTITRDGAILRLLLMLMGLH